MLLLTYKALKGLSCNYIKDLLRYNDSRHTHVIYDELDTHWNQFPCIYNNFDGDCTFMNYL